MWPIQELLIGSLPPISHVICCPGCTVKVVWCTRNNVEVGHEVRIFFWIAPCQHGYQGSITLLSIRRNQLPDPFLGAVIDSSCHCSSLLCCSLALNNSWGGTAAVHTNFTWGGERQDSIYQCPLAPSLVLRLSPQKQGEERVWEQGYLTPTVGKRHLLKVYEEPPPPLPPSGYEWVPPNIIAGALASSSNLVPRRLREEGSSMWVTDSYLTLYI